MSNTVLGGVNCQSCGGALDAQAGRGVIRCSYCGTDNVLKGEARRIVVQHDNPTWLVALYEAISREMDLEELEELCLKAGQRYGVVLTLEDFGGQSRKAKARELVMWFMRRRVGQILVDVLVELRPQIEII